MIHAVDNTTRQPISTAVEHIVPSSREPDTDATKLKFPIGTVAAIVGTAIGVVTAQQLGQAQLKSDVRDILTRMELQVEVDRAQQSANEERYQAIKATVDQLSRRMELLQMQYQQIDKAMSQRTR